MQRLVTKYPYCIKAIRKKYIKIIQISSIQLLVSDSQMTKFEILEMNNYPMGIKKTVKKKYDLIQAVVIN